MELSWHEWVTKEGSMPLDDEDDFNLAEYDVRDQVSDTIIDEAIPEYNGEKADHFFASWCSNIKAHIS